MEVKINKDIRTYTENMAFGLSLRQCLFGGAGLTLSVVVFFALRNHLHIEVLSWICIFTVAPFAVLGFISYNGMTAEQFIYAWLKSEIIYPKRLKFQDTNLYREAIDRAKNTKNMASRKQRAD